MKKRQGILALLAAAALLYVVAARASSVRPALFAPDAAKTAARLPPELRQERGFIKAAAASSRFEAEASRLALDKASDPRIRAFAAEVIKDHNTAQAELLHLLHARDMALPMLENEHRRVLKRLGRLGGRKFEREYLEQVGLNTQRDDIRQYEAAAVASRDPVLKGWIDQRLPALRYRLATAERIGPAARTGGREVARAAAPGARGPQPPQPKTVLAPVNGSRSR